MQIEALEGAEDEADVKDIREEAKKLKQKLKALDDLKATAKGGDVEALEEKIGAALELGMESDKRNLDEFFDRLEKTVAKIYGNKWATAKVIKVHETKNGEDLYDIEFLDD